jgi:hypothetical protein
MVFVMSELGVFVLGTMKGIGTRVPNQSKLKNLERSCWSYWTQYRYFFQVTDGCWGSESGTFLKLGVGKKRLRQLVHVGL